MKNIFYITIVSLAVFFAACEPQKEVAPDLGSLPDGEFTVDATDPNNIVFTAPAGYLYNWDFGTGQTSNNQTETVYYPFIGDYEVSLLLGGKAGVTKLTKIISVAVNDPEIGTKDVWKELTGGGNGQTWVYATDNPDGTFYYMVAPYDWDEYWWSPVHDDGEPLPGIFNEMKFDLEGGVFNFTLFDKQSADDVVVGEKGLFVLNTSAMTLQIVNSHIPDYDDGGGNLNPEATATGKYDIKFISDDELVLHQSQFVDDYDWVWRFKRKGYNFPAK